MIQRGRKSATSTEGVVVIEGGFGQRPDPLPDLTEHQAVIWREVVASEPPDFFSSSALRGLLQSYCRHREAADNISEVINTFKPEWLKSAEGAKRYQILLRMREMETRAAATMATKLRLTNQSRYNALSAATAARNAAKGTKPWDL